MSKIVRDRFFTITDGVTLCVSPKRGFEHSWYVYTGQNPYQNKILSGNSRSIGAAKKDAAKALLERF